MRKNRYYRAYYLNLARFLVLGIIPLILLTCWNYNIYKHMQSSSNSIEQHSDRESRNNQENELARVLMGIVILFVCCHALRIFFNFHESIMIKSIIWCNTKGKYPFPLWVSLGSLFNEIMLAINSSSNMIIYFCLNSNFRKQVLKCIMKRHQNSNQEAITMDSLISRKI